MIKKILWANGEINPMKIYMYNTWFGDCFRIDNSGDLYVDFGIHSHCLKNEIYNRSLKEKINRDKVHELVATEIVNSSKGNASFLLTHYHLDHYSGLLYMKNNPKYISPVFKTLYLPNIWNIPNSRSIITILLMISIMENSRLSKKGCTLIELVRFICKNVINVQLIKRGDVFEKNQYIALWPNGDSFKDATQVLLPFEKYSWSESVQLIAEELGKIVNEIVASKDKMELDEAINLLEKKFYELPIDDIVKVLEIKKHKENLNQYGNKISIVFQNANRCEDNLLFTGDISASCMTIIVNNVDKKVKMYDDYKYIKIPHHGTKGYWNNLNYYDFSRFSPEYIMIPNGKCGTKDSYKICKEYAGMISAVAKKQNIKVYCSNCNWCKNNTAKKKKICRCGAKDCIVVFPNIFVEIV